MPVASGGANIQRSARSLLLPVIFGAVQVVLTLDLAKMSVTSDNSFLAGIQRCLVFLLFPGIFGAMAIGGNVHAWSLWVAAGLNGLIYFALIWIAIRFASRLVRHDHGRRR
jgi:hypothetical protein